MNVSIGARAVSALAVLALASCAGGGFVFYGGERLRTEYHAAAAVGEAYLKKCPEVEAQLGALMSVKCAFAASQLIIKENATKGRMHFEVHGKLGFAEVDVWMLRPAATWEAVGCTFESSGKTIDVGQKVKMPPPMGDDD